MPNVNGSPGRLGYDGCMRPPSIQLLVLAGLCAAAGLTGGRRAQAQSASPFDVLESSIDDIHVALRSGRVICHAVVEQYLDRIEAYNRQGPALNAVQTVNARAIAEADRLDATAKGSGPIGPLHAPSAGKDQLDTSDMATTLGRRCSGTSSRRTTQRS